MEESKKIRPGSDTPAPVASMAGAILASGQCNLAFPSILKDSIHSVIRHIEEVVSDSDQYGDDEAPPSEDVVRTAKQSILSIAELGYNALPKTYVSVYYGELAITWKTETNLVRLTFRPDGHIQIYKQANYKISARGETVTVTPRDSTLVARDLAWLCGDSDGSAGR
jgi:hypothetical protein